jgi:hypothetical protein
MAASSPYFSSVKEKRYNETGVRMVDGEQQIVFNIIM